MRSASGLGEGSLEGMSVPSIDPRPNGLQNARDVGGLRTRDGGRVRSGVLFRSDAPYAGDGPAPLEPWPPQVVVDLRSPGEYGDGPHPLTGASTTVIKRSLLAAGSPAEMVAAAEEGGLTLRSVYAGLLDTGGTAVAEIAHIVASADGPVLVHCTAGKDRTGITVAAILAAVGVERDEIVTDFVTTAENTDAILARMAATWPEEIRD
jgi:protein-tyrosine phosphatase